MNKWLSVSFMFVVIKTVFIELVTLYDIEPPLFRGGFFYNLGFAKTVFRHFIFIKLSVL